MIEPVDNRLYEAALVDSVYFIQKDAGFLTITGADQIDFLQRQTTNDMRLLGNGQALLNVLTSPTARILDVFYLMNVEIPPDNQAGLSSAINILTLPGQEKRTFQYLKSRIFFMDKVILSDQSHENIQLDLIGPNAAGRLHNLGILDNLSLNEYKKIEHKDFHFFVLRQNPALGTGFRLIVPVASVNQIVNYLQGQQISEIDQVTYDVLRVEAGLPTGGHELIDSFTPLEVGLRTAISGDKGCYTGQEVIARQLTYDKVTQSLCGLRFENGFPEGNNVTFEEKPAGVLTSLASSPRFGNIGLGIIKRPYNSPGTQVYVGTKQAIISEIPFK